MQLLWPNLVKFPGFLSKLQIDPLSGDLTRGVDIGALVLVHVMWLRAHIPIMEELNGKSRFKGSC